MSPRVLSTTWKRNTGSPGKSFGECCGSSVLTAACHRPSNHCIPAVKFVSVLGSWIATAHRRCWTPTKLCAATTPLHSLYQWFSFQPFSCSDPFCQHMWPNEPLPKFSCHSHEVQLCSLNRKWQWLNLEVIVNFIIRSSRRIQKNTKRPPRGSPSPGWKPLIYINGAQPAAFDNEICGRPLVI